MDQKALDYNTDLANVLSRMGATAGFEARRQVFRTFTHRALDPQFFPSLFQLSIALANGANEKNQRIIGSVISAALTELRQFLSGLESQTLNHVAIALDLVVRPLAAMTNPNLGLDPGVELARAFIHHRLRLQTESDLILAEIERMGEAAVDRSHGSGPAFEEMGEIGDSFRTMPRHLQLMGRLLELAELHDSEAARQHIRSHRRMFEPPAVEDPEEAALSLHWVTQALKEVDATAEVGSTLVVLLEEGVGMQLSAIEYYLSKGVVADTEAFDEEGNLIAKWDEEDEIRHQLAAAGPSVVCPAIRCASAKLRTEAGVMQIFQRASDLLLEVIHASGESADATSGLLAVALATEQDPNVRALAAIFCGLHGVNADAVRMELMRVCAHDDDPWVKLGSAAVLVATPGTPDEIGLASMRLIMDWLQRTQPPEVLQFVLNGSDETAAGVVISLLPGLIAERRSNAQDASVPSPTVCEEPAAISHSGGLEPRDPASRLRQLEELRGTQLISEDEYQTKRKAILDGL